MGMFIETIRNQAPVMQRTVVEQRLHVAAARTQTADWMTNAKSVAQGLFAIAGDSKSIYESKGMSAASAGDIYAGLQQVLGVSVLMWTFPFSVPFSPTVAKPGGQHREEPRASASGTDGKLAIHHGCEV